MMEWISQNSGTLQFFTNLGTLFVWLFYAQLLYNNYRRDTRARILINKGVSDDDLDSPCLICNMSKEPVFIQGLIVELETSEGTFTKPATDSGERLDSEGGIKGLGERTRQGPLNSGACITVKDFRQLINRGAGAGDLSVGSGVPQDEGVEFYALCLTIISFYAAEDRPFGVCRRFSLDYSDAEHPRITPTWVDTKRLTSRKDKKQVEKWLRECT